jgi:hypothetical protein
MYCILAVRSQIKIKFGRQGFHASHFQGPWQEMDKEIKGFANLSQAFAILSETKMQEGIFFGPQIKELFEDDNFSTELKATERRAWETF